MSGGTAAFLRGTIELCPIPPAPPPSADLRGRRVLVLNGSPPARASVCRAVRRYGGLAIETLDGAGIDMIIDLTLHGTRTPVAPAAYHEPMRRTIDALHHVYENWSTETDTRRHTYVAVTTMGGTMGLSPAPDSQPISGTWAGLCKTLPREMPACQIRVIDLGPLPDPGEALLTEILSGSHLEVGIQHDRRLTLVPRRLTAYGEPIEITPDDVLLLTGGGRGIGFEIALEMAVRTGCRVIVSGRTPLPDPATPWLVMDDDDFAALERREYAEREPGVPPSAVRRRIRQMRQLRQISRNLLRAERAEARIEYHPCDITVAEDAAALVSRAGPDLSMVVHNAGIDVPARLAKKTVQQVQDVIAVKVDGFLRLLQAVGDRPLKMLCAVGSLTGRYGGMVGQIDYAAGNEGLARLAMWAGHRSPYPVKSLSWPTWHDQGLVSNLEVAARYMTPLAVDAGLKAWRAELGHAGSGEIGFMATVGEATPQQVRGVTVPSDYLAWQEDGSSAGGLPDDVLTRRFFLGEAVSYSMASRITTDHHIEPAWAGFLNDVRINGRAGVPISIVLEYMISGAQWLAPPIGPLMQVSYVRNAWVDTHRFEVGRAPLTFRREARVVTDGRSWDVHVELRTGERAIAGGRCGFGDADPPEILPDARDEPPCPAPRPGRTGYGWLPLAGHIGPWNRVNGRWTAKVAPARAPDLFAMTVVPRLRLPAAHLETIFAIAPGARREILHLDEMSIACSGVPENVVVGADGTCADVLNGDGAPLLRIAGCGWADEP